MSCWKVVYEPFEIQKIKLYMNFKWKYGIYEKNTCSKDDAHVLHDTLAHGHLLCDPEVSRNRKIILRRLWHPVVVAASSWLVPYEYSRPHESHDALTLLRRLSTSSPSMSTATVHRPIHSRAPGRTRAVSAKQAHGPHPHDSAWKKQQEASDIKRSVGSGLV